MDNPILEYIRHIDNGVFIPFDKIKSEHFEPAFEHCLAVARKNLDQITENEEEPTFANTIEAIEYFNTDLIAVTSIFLNLKEAHTNEELREIGERVLPLLAELTNDLLLNEKIFERVKTIHDVNDIANTEEKRLLERTYLSFVRKGAFLNKNDKELVREIDKKLIILTQKFAENLLSATNDYKLIVTDIEKLSGIPERLLSSAKSLAEKEGKADAWIFTLHAPSWGPFMDYAENEELRKEMYLAYHSRANSGMFDNKPVLLEIVNLRDKKAKILGYESHAHYVLENRMAKNPDMVYTFFDSLYADTFNTAVKDYKELSEYKEKVTGSLAPVEGWDVGYYAEKLQEEKYAYNEEKLREYYSIDNVVNGLFDEVNRLYGITVQKRTDIPVYHEDMFTYEVIDSNGDNLGIVYFDLFPRASKRAGGWIDALRNQYIYQGTDIRPHLLIVCNLTPPSATHPALFSQREAETLFHEFGHALHSLFSKCKYESRAGTNVLWDFVELPSQFMDTFLIDPRGVQPVAKHYQTNEAIPEELLKKVIESNKFQAGWVLLGQLGASVLDMKWHDGTSRGVEDVEAFEIEIRKKYRILPAYPSTCLSPDFNHIFNGGYDAGYYSYLWSQLLAADAFEYFQENGLFNKEIANKFREHILSKGDSEDPDVLYRKFRGRDADPGALLRVRGIM